MKIKLGILDNNKAYIDRLMRYFNTRYSDSIEFFAFYDYPNLVQYLDNSKVDVLICDPDAIPETFQTPKSSMLAYWSETSEVRTIKDVRAVCKYQNAELIYREILNLFAELDKRTAFKMSGNSCPVFLFIGASGGAGTTTSAIAASIRLAEMKKKVLYLNLEENGSIKSYLNGAGNADLSEVLYAVKSNTVNLPLKLESMVRRDIHGVYYFEPFAVTLDAHELHEGNLKEILEVLTKYGNYDMIIVDAESFMSSKRDVLFDYSGTIFLIVADNDNSTEKLNRLLNEFTILDDNSDLRIMPRVKIVCNQVTGTISNPGEKYGLKPALSIPRLGKSSSIKIAETISQNIPFENYLI